MTRESNQLAASGLACVRGDVTLFEGLDLKLDAGEVLQIQGANGSGKTSLLRILCGLSPPAAGTIEWNGTYIGSAIDDYQAALSYIGHRRGVCEDLSPLENLQFACALDQPGTTAACRAALESLGLGRRMHAPARFLSAGQIQRTALARLLMTNTSLWLLDEPFTALDSAGRTVIERLLERHAHDGGLSIIATHQAMDLGATPVHMLRLDPN